MEKNILCENCINKYVDIKSGILCNISGLKPNITNKCDKYEYGIAENPNVSYNRLDNHNFIYHKDVVKNIKGESSNIDDEKSQKEMIYGGILLITGILLSVLSFVLSFDGRSYFIFIGLIFVGLIRFIKGLGNF